MPKFILIDHSVTDLGGHHFTYAKRVIDSAKAMGYDIYFAVNRKYKPDLLEKDLGIQIFPVYQYGYWERIGKQTIFVNYERANRCLRKLALKFKVRFANSKYGMAVVAWRTNRSVLMPALKDLGFWRWALAIALSPFALLGGVAYGAVKVFNKLFPKGRYLRNLKLRSKISSVYFRYSMKMANVGYIKAFYRDTQTLLNKIHVDKSDIIFIPTLALEELSAIAKLFKPNDPATYPSWHFVLRRNIYIGREPDYPDQHQQILGTKKAYYGLAQQFKGYPVFFYTDTIPLTKQYDSLGAFKFKTLPVPVDEAFYQGDSTVSPRHITDSENNITTSGNITAPGNTATYSGDTTDPGNATDSEKTSSSAHSSKLNIIYLGDARNEKGYQLLPNLIQVLHYNYALSDRIRFTLQSNFSSVGDFECIIARSELEQYEDQVVRVLKAPLSNEEYTNYFLKSDIVLILYDRDNYYARSSGIFAEAIYGDKPSIIPSGSWMATEISHQIYQYHQQLAEQVEVLGKQDLLMDSGQAMQMPNAQGAQEQLLNVTSTPITIKVPCVQGSNYVYIDALQQTESTGNFISLSVAFHDQYDDCIKLNLEVIGGIGGDAASTLIPIPEEAEYMHVSVSNAYAVTPFMLQRLTLTHWKSPADLPLFPIAAVYSRDEDIPEKLYNLVNHIDAYTRTCQTFGRAWRAFHSPDKIMELLEESVLTYESNWRNANEVAPEPQTV